jgi:DNA-binding NarL/FixJ family response regulator
MRVMVADDAALFREGLARLLADCGFDVVAAVGDARRLLECVAAAPPDAVVVDIRMPPTHTTEGLDAARALAVSHPGGCWCSPRTASRRSPCSSSSRTRAARDTC